MAYWLSTNHEIYASVSNLTFKYTALLLVMPVSRSPYVPLEMVFVDKYKIAHGIRTALWLLAECFMNLWVANVCLLLDAIDFPYSHE